jgi:hypothetical protein
MNSANRRGFLKIAGAGAAAAGAASLLPGAESVAIAEPAPVPEGAHAPAATLPDGAAGSMVAYIHDVSSGEVAVMVEGRQVIISDHDLVARLATAVHAADTAV